MKLKKKPKKMKPSLTVCRQSKIGKDRTEMASLYAGEMTIGALYTHIVTFPLPAIQHTHAQRGTVSYHICCAHHTPGPTQWDVQKKEKHRSTWAEEPTHLETPLLIHLPLHMWL